MTRILSLYHALTELLERSDWLLPTLARFVFAAVLAGYFWASGLTKLGEGIFGIFTPSTGAYAQIFPKAFEAVSYDSSQLGVFHWVVVFAGTVAEFILPLLLILGLMTRLAAVGMIGFVAVQTLTDLYGHGGIEHAETLGAWFDRLPDSLILDQRAFWMLALITLVIKGAGPVSVDALLRNGPLARLVSQPQ